MTLKTVYLVWRIVQVGDECLLDIFSNEEEAKTYAKAENEADGVGYANVYVEEWLVR